MKDYLDKPCYKENLNEGQKNWKELLSGGNLIVVCVGIAVNVLFVVLFA